MHNSSFEGAVLGIQRKVNRKSDADVIDRQQRHYLKIHTRSTCYLKVALPRLLSVLEIKLERFKIGEDNVHIGSSTLCLPASKATIQHARSIASVSHQQFIYASLSC
jgi:hypothetical protein